LDRLARNHPHAVGQPLADAGKAIIKESIPLSRAEYAIYRTAVVLREQHGDADVLSACRSGFESALDKATRSRGISGYTNTDEEGDNSHFRLVHDAAMNAAASAGSNEYLTALQEFPELVGRPDPTPAATARFLVRATDDDRTKALDIVVDDFGIQFCERITESIVELSLSEREGRSRIAVLDRLLPMVTDESVRDSGLEVIASELSADTWVTRRLATNTIGELGRSRAIPADDAIDRLLSMVTDTNDEVANVAHDRLIPLCNSGEMSPEDLITALVENARHAEQPGKSCMAIKTLGTRYLRVRPTAVDQLVTLASEAGVTVQKAALQALIELADTAPDSVGAVATQIEPLTSDSDPNVRHYASRCLARIDSES
jgi:HEAT repeat protein